MPRLPQYGNRNDASTAIEIGLKLIQRGFHYVWGGYNLDSYSGLDCSGFVSCCYFSDENHPGHNTRKHCTTGNLQELKNGYNFSFLSYKNDSSYLKTGDIVFYTKAETTQEAGHTGIILNNYIYNGKTYNCIMQSAGSVGGTTSHGLHYNPGWKHILRPKEGVGIYIVSVIPT